MTDSVLLVDYENVGKVDLGAIPNDVRVHVFVGASQKTVPTALLRAVSKLGERFVQIDIEGHGKNALDFHIAFYLGEYLVKAPGAQYVVLSRDKGFDPLVGHLESRGFAVRRAETIAEAFPASETSERKARPEAVTQWEHSWTWLAGIERTKRPRKRKNLVAHLHTHYSKTLTLSGAEALVDRMIAEKKITEVDGAITYHF
jgi:hypothetical protein